MWLGGILMVFRWEKWDEMSGKDQEYYRGLVESFLSEEWSPL